MAYTGCERLLGGLVQPVPGEGPLGRKGHVHPAVRLLHEYCVALRVGLGPRQRRGVRFFPFTPAVLLPAVVQVEAEHGQQCEEAHAPQDHPDDPRAPIVVAVATCHMQAHSSQ